MPMYMFIVVHAAEYMCASTNVYTKTHNITISDILQTFYGCLGTRDI